MPTDHCGSTEFQRKRVFSFVGASVEPPRGGGPVLVPKPLPTRSNPAKAGCVGSVAEYVRRRPTRSTSRPRYAHLSREPRPRRLPCPRRRPGDARSGRTGWATRRRTRRADRRDRERPHVRPEVRPTPHPPRESRSRRRYRPPRLRHRIERSRRRRPTRSPLLARLLHSVVQPGNSTGISVRGWPPVHIVPGNNRSNNASPALDGNIASSQTCTESQHVSAGVLHNGPRSRRIQPLDSAFGVADRICDVVESCQSETLFGEHLSHGTTGPRDAGRHQDGESTADGLRSAREKRAGPTNHNQAATAQVLRALRRRCESIMRGTVRR